MTTTVRIEDSNTEVYHINPMHVVYIKERFCGKEKCAMWKMMLSTGEVIMTKNKDGVQKILDSVTKRYA
jgi:hypothetical protein